MIEEKHIGGDLHKFPACFGKNNKHVFVISRSHVIGFDAYTGKRICLLKHEAPVVGMTWRNDKLYTFTKNAEIYHWTDSSGAYTRETRFPIHTGFNELSHVYQVGQKIFIVILLIGKIYAEHEHRVYSLSNLDDPEPKLSMEAILPTVVDNRRLLDVSDEFAVLCTRRKIHLLQFRSSKMEEASLLYEFHHKGFERVVNNEMVDFDGIQIVGGTLFASLNIGRVYIWHGIHQGFSKKRKPLFVHVHSNSVVFAVSNHLTMFCGSGDCKITKWHTQTSGAGRWQYPQRLDGLNLPVRSLSISDDSTHMLACLEDNSLLMGQTATMTIVSRPEVMHWPSDPQHRWLGLHTDPAMPDLLVTSAYLGTIQWIDPTRWLTVGMLDVTEENLKQRDNLLYDEKEIWSNVYLVLLTPNTVVSCECHRKDLHLERNKTRIKFFNRLTPGSIDFKLEDIMVHEDRVLFLQSNHDEALPGLESSLRSELEEILKIDEFGVLTILVRDEQRSGRRRPDLHRTLQWQDSTIASCSRVRDGIFATVNTLQKYSYVLVWDMNNMNVLDNIDSLSEVNQVQWGPRRQLGNAEDTSGVLLISCIDCLAAYDVQMGALTWMVMQRSLKIHANSYLAIAYYKRHVTLFDCQSGQTIRDLKFSNHTTQIITTGTETNPKFCALTDKDELILLKEDTDANSIMAPALPVYKKTPFSQLVEQAKTAAKERANKDRIQIVHTPSAKKLLDGPAYALAPITQLAPAFVKSCLIQH